MTAILQTPAGKAAALGLIAGMRTFYAPAVLTHLYSRHQAESLAGSPLEFMKSITASKVFKVLAAGELIGDKLPNTPNRTAIPGLVGRALSGILCGAVVYKAEGSSPLIGGLIGGAASIASTFGCFFLRRGIGKSTKIPDPYIGAIEDALVIGAGIAIARSA
ncbi:DUF4126 family protein [Mucilaginibacter gilvus]|uniref:DUF4126 family protein n=1 Tax=Mucilaginibacter gilvus TaxID=2305909 RepID=A0A444MRH6_9SPHI|nr:DUF4126 family protein [Mucilaginibacter gilvus]RWY54193.1 DUF4126 family protein [Mucilaginibacter gilvus]